MAEFDTRRRLIMAWTTEELPSVKTIVLGSTVMGFFDGTSAWYGEFENSTDRFDQLLDAVFYALRYHAKQDARGTNRMKLSTRQAEAILYYADVMADATNPANTGDDDRTEFTAAKRLLAQIAKKWPEARL